MSDKPPAFPDCRHCGSRPGSWSRGLCRACFKDPDIVRLYPPRTALSESSFASAEELEEMIKKRAQTMPERQRGGD